MGRFQPSTVPSRRGHRGPSSSAPGPPRHPPQPVGDGRHQRTGFVGSAVFGLPTRASLAAQRALVALWSFAAFAGVGAQTTHGLGHVRVHLHEQPARPGPECNRDAVREKPTGPISTTPTEQARHPSQNENV
ncbi:CRISPR system precrRNA processing endoribonuclease RAMP protein Cas6 [Nocardiopsis synnemataformans]|uniref:CRISPR system precrRNA processing endoribonuclease RAMP protein Cas6 n=1 Tax=Nocardiopsis synnemataformans TaxID=61305 RepID=UPI003EBE4A3F